MLDLLIKNGTVIDGTGKSRFQSNVAVDHGILSLVGDQIMEAVKVIDARDRIVCPGFIDIHGHSDFTFFIDNRGQSKITQGITTEVVGNCGFTAGPVHKDHQEELLQYLGNTIVLDDVWKKNWLWKSQAKYLARLSESGLPYNIAPLVGHGTIRVAAMGFSKQKPTSRALNNMVALLEEEMGNGVFGLSAGLEYEPGSFADPKELITLAKVVRRFNGIYTTHLKSEGRDLLKCIEEAIHIGKESGVSVEISHLKASYQPNWGIVSAALEMIDKANREGVDIGFDVYPYTAAGSGLIDLIPPWYKERGSSDMLRTLSDKERRGFVIEDMKKYSEIWDNPMLTDDWDAQIRIALLKTDANKKYEGATICQAAKDMGLTPYEAVIALLIAEDASIKAIFFAMCDEDLETIMKHPSAMFCTDGRAVATSGELSKGSVHPRYYGTYPRIIGHYARDKKLFSMEEAIMKSTSLPAEKLRLQKRGIIADGYIADITVFDPEKIIDKATFDRPHQISAGVEQVIVNGSLAVENGIPVHTFPGQLLRNQS
ncbi:MAG TPA: N-acyl-D-amino-acid deacylase [Clostridiales bacterium]|nr:N-acyl-D-amino-acid deacylase [Clostridiales bacterium]